MNCILFLMSKVYCIILLIVCYALGLFITKMFIEELKGCFKSSSRRDIFFMISALIFIIALICFATVAAINLIFFLMEVWY